MISSNNNFNPLYHGQGYLTGAALGCVSPSIDLTQPSLAYFYPLNQPVSLSRRQECLDGLRVQRQPLALSVGPEVPALQRALVGRDSQPPEHLLQLVRRTGDEAGPVRVLDPQDELAVVGLKVNLDH